MDILTSDGSKIRTNAISDKKKNKKNHFLKYLMSSQTSFGALSFPIGAGNNNGTCILFILKHDTKKKKKCGLKN